MTNARRTTVVDKSILVFVVEISRISSDEYEIHGISEAIGINGLNFACIMFLLSWGGKFLQPSSLSRKQDNGCFSGFFRYFMGFNPG